MIKAYYISMRTIAIALLFLAGAPLASRSFSAQQQPATPQTTAATHEGLTVSAHPWTSAALYKKSFGKNSLLKAGLVAIQVTFRNDSDQVIKINLDKIQLLLTLSPDNRQNLGSLTADDVADAVRNPGTRDVTATRRPFPGRSPGARDKHWDEVREAAQDAGVPSRLLAPHSTLQGLLYFNLRGQYDLLDSARLYIPDLFTLGKNHPLLYFEIDLGRSASG